MQNGTIGQRSGHILYEGLAWATFASTSSKHGAALAILPRHVLGREFTPPSEKLNIAGIGIGGMGRNNLINLASQNIVALCDTAPYGEPVTLSPLPRETSNPISYFVRHIRDDKPILFRQGWNVQVMEVLDAARESARVGRAQDLH